MSCFCYLAEITEDPTSTLSFECLRTESGEDYVGRVNYSLSGIPCQKWGDNSPHKHGYNDITWFADYAANANAIIQDVVNFCRNPIVLSSSDARPWCYTTSKDIKYAYCDIPRCKSKYVYAREISAIVVSLLSKICQKLLSSWGRSLK